MHLSFVIPPAALRIGGLDTAISSLKEALEQDPDVRVRCDERMPDFSADAVHFHGLWMPGHIAAYRECRKRGIPYAVSPHGMLEPWALSSKRWKKAPFLKLIDRPNLRRSQAIFVTSALEGHNVRQATACHHLEELSLGLSHQVMIDRESARHQFGLSPDDRVLLYLSRIDRKKGLDRLLDSLEGISYGSWQLWIVGDGDPQWIKSLKHRAASRKRQLPTIHWLGPQWDEAKWPYLAAADLFCLPTHSENFGLAVLESLWVGTPVLTTPHTPWASYADTHGITITTNDTPSLRKTLEEQFRTYQWSDEQRQQLKQWSHAQFHWNHLREAYLKAYSRLISLAA